MEYTKDVATDATVLFRLCKFTEKHIACQYRDIALYLTPRSPWSSLLHPRNQKFFFRFNKIIDESFDYYQRRSITRTPQSVLIKLWETILTCRSKILYNILFEDKTLVMISGNSDRSESDFCKATLLHRSYRINIASCIFTQIWLHVRSVTLDSLHVE